MLNVGMQCSLTIKMSLVMFDSLGSLPIYLTMYLA